MQKIRLLCLLSILGVGISTNTIAATIDGVPVSDRQKDDMGDGQDKDRSGGLLGDRLSIKMGYKVWIARWQTTAFSQSQFEGIGGGARQITTHDSFMSGPSGSVRLALRDSSWFNSLIGSFTLLNGGFNFQTTGVTQLFSRSGLQENNQDATRKDYTATIGLSIWESIGVFAGYYWSEQHFTIDNIFQPSLGSPTLIHTRSNGHRELQGPIFGFYASGPVSERVSLYGNIAYALLNLRSDQGVAPPIQGLNTDAVQGWAAEIGASIRGPKIWKIGTDLQVGFRGQMILKSFGANAPDRGSPPNTFGNDVTWGPTVTISAVF